MNCFEILGGRRLYGEITVQGSKNSALPLIAACLLNKGKNVLHNCPDLSDEVARWLKMVAEAGIALTIVSNAKQYRVEPFAAKVGLSCVWMAAKPLPFGFWRGVRTLGVPRRQCLAIGDQTFTDTLGAKLAGVRVVQLQPIQLAEDKPFMMFKRRIEAYILKWEGRR